MSKYIIDIPNGVEWGVVTCRTEDGFYTRDFDSLEELNSDYISKHFSDLQDTAYKRGVNDGSIDVKERVDGAYQRGLEDAWEAARKIADMWGTMDNDDLLETFGVTAKIGESTIGTLFKKQTANEAMLELEAYEEKQKADDEIKVGDEVRRKTAPANERGGIVTKEYENTYYIMWTDGSSGKWDKDRVVKTGRHFDIASILKEMQS